MFGRSVGRSVFEVVEEQQTLFPLYLCLCLYLCRSGLLVEVRTQFLMVANDRWGVGI